MREKGVTHEKSMIDHSATVSQRRTDAFQLEREIFGFGCSFAHGSRILSALDQVRLPEV